MRARSPRSNCPSMRISRATPKTFPSISNAIATSGIAASDCAKASGRGAATTPRNESWYCHAPRNRMFPISLLIAAEVGQGRLRVKAGHAVTVGESGGYFHRPLSGDEMQVMQLPDASKIRFQNGHQY